MSQPGAMPRIVLVGDECVELVLAVPVGGGLFWFGAGGIHLCTLFGFDV